MMDFDMAIEHMTKDELFAIIRIIERHHDVRIGMITKNDVQDIFELALASEGIERRDMTDEEWEKFTHSWFWVKGHSEVFWEGVQESVSWDLRDEKILPETVII